MLVAGACSSGSNSAGGGSSVRPLDQIESAEASESAGSGDSTSASATADGPVSAQELSDEDLGYTVASIPEDLDETQTRVLRDFIAYDQATWKIWFGKADLDVIFPTVTGASVQGALETYADLEGGHANPPVTVGVSDITVGEDATSATVTGCTDRSRMTWVDAEGKDITTSTAQNRMKYVEVMVLGDDGRWLSSDGTQVSINECTTEAS